MSVIVRIPTTLRPISGGQAEVKVEGATLGDVLAGLEAAHPGFQARGSSTTRASSASS